MALSPGRKNLIFGGQERGMAKNPGFSTWLEIEIQALL
jgi:hypothetical protein